MSTRDPGAGQPRPTAATTEASAQPPARTPEPTLVAGNNSPKFGKGKPEVGEETELVEIAGNNPPRSGPPKPGEAADPFTGGQTELA